MKMKSRTAVTASAVLLLGAVSLLSGCTDHGKWKAAAQQALTKQAEMKTYSFAGSADLNVALAPKTNMNPMTASLLGMFTQSKLEWKGIASTDPVRLEASLSSTPAGSSVPLELPLLIQDNKLYMNIPLLNQKDEYFAIDMSELKKLTGKTGPELSPESLKSITKTVSEVSKLAIADLNPKWFEKGKAAALADGSKADVIQIDITDNNAKEMSDAIRSHIGDIAETLKSSGIWTDAQVEDWKKNSASFRISAPGSISITVDDQGFVRDQAVNISYVTSGSDGKEKAGKLRFDQSYDNINKEPGFTKKVPEHVRPLSDILKLLLPKLEK